MANCPRQGYLSKSRLNARKGCLSMATDPERLVQGKVLLVQLVQGKTTCPTCPKTWHCYQEGGKEARDNSIEWSYKTNVSASFELYEVYIGPLIGLWWTNVVRREDLQRFESGWRWPFWH